MKRPAAILALVAVILAGCSDGGAVEDAAARIVGVPTPAVAVADAVTVETDVVTRVHDGDTFYTLRHPEGVRLIGADTPEITNNTHNHIGCWGKPATNRAKELLPVGATVTLTIGRGHSYNRVLADVTVTIDGVTVDVASALIREGLAEALNIAPNDQRADLFNHLQAAAQAARLGEWSGVNPPDAPKGCVNPPQPKETTR